MSNEEPYFSHEKLIVYQLELQFLSWVTILIDEVEEAAPRKTREVRDHLDRACLSSLFNTAEGNGKRQMPIRGRFFDDARGSVTECAACLDALVAKGVCPVTRIQEGKALLLRCASMLTKLIDRFTNGDQVREDEADYGIQKDEDVT
ncbi:MAG TPA: four helix bundle protein [Armatimonadota bacterium]|jgi:four helix bundle protein